MLLGSGLLLLPFFLCRAEDWLFNFILFMAQSGYLHFLRDWYKGFSSQRLEQHFPQTRRSHDRIWWKLALQQKLLFCSRENSKITWYQTEWETSTHMLWHAWPPTRPLRPLPSFWIRVTFNLLCSGRAPKRSWCELHKQHYWQDVQTPQCEEVENHALPPPDEWVAREISSDYHADDWEAGRRWKSWLARSSGWNSACL